MSPWSVSKNKGDSSKINRYVYLNDRSSLVYTKCTFAVSRKKNFIFDCELMFNRSPMSSFSYSKKRFIIFSGLLLGQQNWPELCDEFSKKKGDSSKMCNLNDCLMV